MKLFGNSSHGRRDHEDSRLSDSSIGSPNFEEPEVKAKNGDAPDAFADDAVNEAEYKKKKARSTIIIIAVVVAVIAIAAVIIWKSAVKPPEFGDVGLTTPAPEVTETPQETVAPVESEQPVEETPEPSPEHSGDELALTGDRKNGCYTILVMGEDRDAHLTDTIMVARFDTVNHTLNIVSVPRDTMVNVSWSNKKINTVYSSRGLDMEKVVETFQSILGFKVDCYALVNLQAFVEIIDAIDGVDYDVPVDMYYNAPDQKLSIAIPAGPTHLDGEEALKVMRFRSGYANADLGRIDTQHDFLMTAAKQVLQLKNVLAIDDLARIFKEYVETNMTVGNLVWFATEFFEVDSEDIVFATSPGTYSVTIKGGSYCSFNVTEWLAYVNESINPYNTEITVSNVDLLYYDGGVKSTSGVVAGGVDSFFDYAAYFKSIGLNESGTAPDSAVGTDVSTDTVTDAPTGDTDTAG